MTKYYPGFPRYPVAGSLQDYCAVHGYEPLPDQRFRVCYECHHCFVTEQDLLDAHNEILAAIRERSEAGYHPEFTALPPVTRAEQVHCCPYCSHDW